MFDQIGRPIKEKLLTPFIKRLGMKIHPNAVTLFAFSLGIYSVILILKGQLISALVFWLLNRLFDGIDGTIARVTDKQTDFGGYLDLILDFIIYAAVPISLYYYQLTAENSSDPTALSISLACLLASFYVNTASWMVPAALIEKRGRPSNTTTSIEMPSGIIEGTETILFYSLFLLFPSFLLELFWIMTILTWITILHKLFWVWRKF